MTDILTVPLIQQTLSPVGTVTFSPGNWQWGFPEDAAIPNFTFMAPYPCYITGIVPQEWDFQANPVTSIPAGTFTGGISICNMWTVPSNPSSRVASFQNTLPTAAPPLTVVPNTPFGLFFRGILRAVIAIPSQPWHPRMAPIAVAAGTVVFGQLAPRWFSIAATSAPATSIGFQNAQPPSISVIIEPVAPPAAAVNFDTITASQGTTCVSFSDPTPDAGGTVTATVAGVTLGTVTLPTTTICGPTPAGWNGIATTIVLSRTPTIGGAPLVETVSWTPSAPTLIFATQQADGSWAFGGTANISPGDQTILAGVGFPDGVQAAMPTITSNIPSANWQQTTAPPGAPGGLFWLSATFIPAVGTTVINGFATSGANLNSNAASLTLHLEAPLVLNVQIINPTSVTPIFVVTAVPPLPTGIITADAFSSDGQALHLGALPAQFSFPNPFPSDSTITVQIFGHSEGGGAMWEGTITTEADPEPATAALTLTCDIGFIMAEVTTDLPSPGVVSLQIGLQTFSFPTDTPYPIFTLPLAGTFTGVAAVSAPGFVLPQSIYTLTIPRLSDEFCQVGGCPAPTILSLLDSDGSGTLLEANPTYDRETTADGVWFRAARQIWGRFFPTRHVADTITIGAQFPGGTDYQLVVGNTYVFRDWDGEMFNVVVERFTTTAIIGGFERLTVWLRRTDV